MPFIIHEDINTTGADFLVTAHGALTLLQPLTPSAEEWIGENIFLPDAEFWGRAIVIDEGTLLALAGESLVVSNHRRTIN